MIVGGYTLDLYCDSELDQPYGTKGHHGGDHAGTFYAQTGKECRRQARAAGWIFQRGRRAICPACAGDPRVKRQVKP